MAIREITLLAVALRIVTAAIVGGLIGLERGLKNRPAGLRTYMLVCTGACLIMLTNQFICQVYSTGDPARMGAQVVSGIGFLGAGTIIVTRRNQIKGLTTAAGLWTAAGVGLTLGIGFYEAALIGAVTIFTVMTLLQKFDNRMHSKTRVVDVYIELDLQLSLRELLRQLRSQDLEVSNIQQEQGESGIRAYLMTVRGKKRCHPWELTEQILGISGVLYLEEL